MTTVDAIRALAALLQESAIEFMVGGSYASSAWGEPRQTHDMDIVVSVSSSEAERLLTILPNDFQIEPSDVRDALKSNDDYRVFQIMHRPTAFKIDAFLIGNDDFSRAEFARRILVELLPDLVVPVATAEDTVIRKLLWFELGNRVSERQWRDVVQVLEGRGGRIDMDYLQSWCEKLEVDELLGQALAEIVE